jgi:ER lumen protein retaining receptor
MQNSKVVERFTAHYVFCLGLSRFFSCAHWILQLLEGNRYLLNALGSGLWPVMVLLSEIVQTFILADFWCVDGRGAAAALALQAAL